MLCYPLANGTNFSRLISYAKVRKVRIRFLCLLCDETNWGNVVEEEKESSPQGKSVPFSIPVLELSDLQIINRARVPLIINSLMPTVNKRNLGLKK